MSQHVASHNQLLESMFSVHVTEINEVVVTVVTIMQSRLVYTDADQSRQVYIFGQEV